MHNTTSLEILQDFSLRFSERNHPGVPPGKLSKVSCTNPLEVPSRNFKQFILAMLKEFLQEMLLSFLLEILQGLLLGISQELILKIQEKFVLKEWAQQANLPKVLSGNFPKFCSENPPEFFVAERHLVKSLLARISSPQMA